MLPCSSKSQWYFYEIKYFTFVDLLLKRRRPASLFGNIQIKQQFKIIYFMLFNLNYYMGNILFVDDVMLYDDVMLGLLRWICMAGPDFVGVPVGSPFWTSDHSAVFIDVVLEQTVPHLVCRQEVYLKNSVDWELVRGDVKSLDWNEIIRSPCSVSSLNKALLCFIRDRVRKWTIVVRIADKP